MRAVAGLSGKLVPHVTEQLDHKLSASVWSENAYQELMAKDNMRWYADSIRRASTWYEKHKNVGFVGPAGDPLPCNFFALGRGCMFGRNCVFRHDSAPPQHNTAGGSLVGIGVPPSMATPPPPLRPAGGLVRPGTGRVTVGTAHNQPYSQLRVPVRSHHEQSPTLTFVPKGQASRLLSPRISAASRGIHHADLALLGGASAPSRNSAVKSEHPKQRAGRDSPPTHPGFIIDRSGDFMAKGKGGKFTGAKVTSKFHLDECRGKYDAEESDANQSSVGDDNSGSNRRGVDVLREENGYSRSGSYEAGRKGYLERRKLQHRMRSQGRESDGEFSPDNSVERGSGKPPSGREDGFEVHPGRGSNGDRDTAVRQRIRSFNRSNSRGARSSQELDARTNSGAASKRYPTSRSDSRRQHSQDGNRKRSRRDVTVPGGKHNSDKGESRQDNIKESSHGSRHKGGVKRSYPHNSDSIHDDTVALSKGSNNRMKKRTRNDDFGSDRNGERSNDRARHGKNNRDEETRESSFSMKRERDTSFSRIRGRDNWALRGSSGRGGFSSGDDRKTIEFDNNRRYDGGMGLQDDSERQRGPPMNWDDHLDTDERSAKRQTFGGSSDNCRPVKTTFTVTARMGTALQLPLVSSVAASPTKTTFSVTMPPNLNRVFGQRSSHGGRGGNQGGTRGGREAIVGLHDVGQFGGFREDRKEVGRD